ncbi:LutC/YkgG family protein [Gynuella sp.]|uniref:LutC/YkgG family protein n=1 Tax=Gynuella sp. TaxID=2969146 RepID=UPI003D10ED55
MSSRDAILARLRSVSPVRHSEPETTVQEISAEDMFSQFKHSLEAVHGDVMLIQPDELASSLESYCRKLGVRSYSCSDHNWLAEHLTQFRAIKEYQWRSPTSVVQHRSELFHHLDMGITSAVGWIAETGTVVLQSSEHEPRALSLVPPCHVVIVRESDGFADMAAFMCQQQTPLPTNLIMISGPSKTADIQQTLAYGAHGPAQFLVIILRQ